MHARFAVCLTVEGHYLVETQESLSGGKPSVRTRQVACPGSRRNAETAQPSKANLQHISVVFVQSCYFDVFQGETTPKKRD